MEGTGRTCPACQAPLGPNARFCPKCGQPAAAAAPGGPAPGSPAQPGQGFAGGPGFTIAAPQAPPAPAPAAPPAAPGWNEPAWEQGDQTVTQFPSRPFQAPAAPPAWSADLPYVPPPGQPPGFEPFRPYQPGGPAAGPPPPGPPPEPFPGPPRQPPRRHDGNRSGAPLALLVTLLVVLVGGGAAAVVLIAHPFSHPSLRETASSGTRSAPAGAGAAPAGTVPSAGASPGASPAVSASPSAVTEQQAATSVATMLGQSVSDRAAINTAYNDVMTCDSALASAPQVFDDAASSRQRLLASLAAMPGRAALPPALLGDLTQAWQASVAADQAFAQWASDESQGCTPSDTGSAAYQATVTPDDNATKYKTAFVAQWNPVAARYNLTQYQQDQL